LRVPYTHVPSDSRKAPALPDSHGNTLSLHPRFAPAGTPYFMLEDFLQKFNLAVDKNKKPVIKCLHTSEEEG
jgi:hypothetical protein